MPNLENLELEIKQMIIEALDLEDLNPEDIDTDTPRFGEGLGLDSIDALELGIAIKKKFAVSLEAGDTDTRAHFRSVASLAAFIRSQSC